MDRSHEDRKWDGTKYIGKWKGLRQFVEKQSKVEQSKVETPLAPEPSIDREQEPSSAPECQAYYIGSNFPLEQPPPGLPQVVLWSPPGLPPVVIWEPPEESPSFGESQADDVDAEQREQLTLEFHGSEATSQPTSTPAVNNQQEEDAGFNDIAIDPPEDLMTDSGLEEDNELPVNKMGRRRRRGHKWTRTKHNGAGNVFRQIGQQPEVGTSAPSEASIEHDQESSSAPECPASSIGSENSQLQPPQQMGPLPAAPALPQSTFGSQLDKLPSFAETFGRSSAAFKSNWEIANPEQLVLTSQASEATCIQPTSIAATNQEQIAEFTVNGRQMQLLDEPDIIIGPPGGLKSFLREAGLEEDNELYQQLFKPGKKTFPTRIAPPSEPPLLDFVPDPTTEPVAHCSSQPPGLDLELKLKGILRKIDASVFFQQFPPLAPEFGTSKQISPPSFENSSPGSQPQSAGARAAKKVRFA